MFTCMLPDLDKTVEQIRLPRIRIKMENLDEQSSIKYVKIFQLEGRAGLEFGYENNSDLTKTLRSIVSSYNSKRGDLANIVLLEPLSFQGEMGLNRLQIATKSDNCKELFQLITVAGQLEVIDPKFVIFLSHVFNTRLPEQLILDELSELVQNNNVNAAINKAKSVQLEDYFECIWQLTDLLHTNNLVDILSLIDLYKTIRPSNPYYKEANERLYILYTSDLFPGQHECYYLEKQLEVCVNSENKRLIAQVFSQLCGNKGLSPIPEKLIGNVKGLITIATHIRFLNKTIADQQCMIKSQEQQLNDLKEESKVPYKFKMF